MFKLFISLFLASVALCGCAQKNATTPQPQPVVQATQDTGSNLIKAGAAMPDLTLSAVDGKPLKLSDVLKGHKALMLNFWFYT